MNNIPNPEDLFKQVTQALPTGLFELHKDLEKNLRVGLDSGLRKINVVTREEFDIQTAVLERTRARLEKLEQQVAALESK
ncbi:accessory factor UbiK family protein [Candidatus Marithrix sp. Canyon 246]|uniref:accessory factor UbiK family protein n=1 Tax=Candidatus Marithrix sp. Canyon 246 TaxID=1827136 RepID=UPI00084A1716|nr:accessory factor UbiK family protein [Candidatus Marithrix sp. Canyon 246]